MRQLRCAGMLESIRDLASQKQPGLPKRVFLVFLVVLGTSDHAKYSFQSGGWVSCWISSMNLTEVGDETQATSSLDRCFSSIWYVWRRSTFFWYFRFFYMSCWLHLTPTVPQTDSAQVSGVRDMPWGDPSRTGVLMRWFVFVVLPCYCLLCIFVFLFFVFVFVVLCFTFSFCSFCLYTLLLHVYNHIEWTIT